MLQANINQIKLYIDDFKIIPLEELFAISYPDAGELQNVQISRFSIYEFITFTRRFFEQLEIELNNENGLVLPLIFSTPEFGQADLQNQINNLLVSIRNRQFPNSENQLSWLLIYQLQNGFYNKSQYKLHPTNVTETKKTQDLIDIQIQNLNGLNEKYKIAIEALENEKKLLSEFKTQKENELLQITNNLESTNTNNNAIQSLLTLSTQSQTKIDALLSEIEKGNLKAQETLADMDKSIAKSKTEFSEFLSSLQTTETKYKNIYAAFETKLDFIESKSDYFVERNSYLDTLIGREVGASLFETFKQRKTELSSPLQFWRWAIGTMTVVTFLGVFAIFTNLFGFIKSDNTLTWELIVVNAIKSSPFIFLLYYTISQYNKERNFQEEYAFKSAVALTINAYADVLKDDKVKDELILKAVFGIYKSPIYNKNKSNKEVNSIIDVLKDVIDKGANVITKNEK